MPDPIVWALEPNAVDQVVEEYGYLTDVLAAYRRLEQRIQLRRHSTGAIEFSFFCDDLLEGQRISVLLQRKRAQPWIVPLWPYRSRPAANITAGDTLIQIPTANIPFTDALGLGPYAVLWRTSRLYELVKLNAIYANAVELAQPVAGTWSAATIELIPARVGRLEQAPRTPWLTPKLLTGRIRFDFDSWSEDNMVPTLTDDYMVMGDQPQPV